MSKLVRDKIPEIIAKSTKKKPKIRIANANTELGRKIDLKIQEEIIELMNAEDIKSKIEELADVYEILDKYIDFHRINRVAVAEEKKRKADEKGRFEKGIIWEE